MTDAKEKPCTNGVCCALLHEMSVIEQKCDSIYMKLSSIENHNSTDSTLRALECAAKDMLEQSSRLREYVEQNISDNGLRIVWRKAYEH